MLFPIFYSSSHFPVPFPSPFQQYSSKFVKLFYYICIPLQDIFLPSKLYFYWSCGEVLFSPISKKYPVIRQDIFYLKAPLQAGIYLIRIVVIVAEGFFKIQICIAVMSYCCCKAKAYVIPCSFIFIGLIQ